MATEKELNKAMMVEMAVLRTDVDALISTQAAARTVVVPTAENCRAAVTGQERSTRTMTTNQIGTDGANDGWYSEVTAEECRIEVSADPDPDKLIRTSSPLVVAGMPPPLRYR